MTTSTLSALLDEAESRASRLAERERAPDRLPQLGPIPPRFRPAVKGRDSLSVIAEFKRRSPSAGAIRGTADPARQALRYRDAGAAALSVLASPAFDGALEDVTAAFEAARLPVLMKDFVVNPSQLRAGRLAGASATLLIVRCLDGGRLRRLHDVAGGLGLDTLAEVHDEAELEMALSLPDAMIGVNNRDLDTLAVDRSRAPRLLSRIPKDRIAVAESGYSEPEHLDEIRGLADAVLIGEALMRADDPAAFIGRAAGSNDDGTNGSAA